MSEKECLLCLRTPIEDLLIYARKIYDDLIASNVANRAAKLIYSAYKKEPYELCGPRPKSIMASALYLSCIMEGDQISKRIIADVVGVTDASLRNLNKRFIKVLEIELPEKVKSLPKPTIRDEDFIELYNQGLEDKKIAEKLGFPYRAIIYRRRKLGLLPISLKTFMEKDLIDLHNQGLNDIQISEKLGVPYYFICKKRLNLKLKPNPYEKMILTDGEFLKYYNMGLFDAEIAAKINASPNSIYKRRLKLNLIANLHRKKMFNR